MCTEGILYGKPLQKYSLTDDVTSDKHTGSCLQERHEAFIILIIIIVTARRRNVGSPVWFSRCVMSHSLHIKSRCCYSDFSVCVAVCQPAAGCIRWHSVCMFSGPQLWDSAVNVPHIQTLSFSFCLNSPTKHSMKHEKQHRICGGNACVRKEHARDGRSGCRMCSNMHSCETIHCITSRNIHENDLLIPNMHKIYDVCEKQTHSGEHRHLFQKWIPELAWYDNHGSWLISLLFTHIIQCETNTMTNMYWELRPRCWKEFMLSADSSWSQMGGHWEILKIKVFDLKLYLSNTDRPS